MTGLFSALIDYMEEEEWKYEILEGETIIRFHFKGRAGRLLCYGEVDEEKSLADLLLVHAGQRASGKDDRRSPNSSRGPTAACASATSSSTSTTARSATRRASTSKAAN